jgi:hypothetical protein
MVGGVEVNDHTREKLLALRGDIAAESATLAALLPAARQAIGDAEAHLRAAKSAERELHEIVGVAVGNEPIANRLARFLTDAEVDNGVAAAPGKARRELARTESEIADCADALRQLDRALAGSWPVKLLGREPPVVIKRTPPEPIEVDLITMPATGVVAA